MDQSKARYRLRRIDWQQSATVIYNFIRAQSHPYPGAYFLLEGKIIRVWSAKLFPYPYYGTHGQVVMVEKDFVVVACGEGTGICLLEVSEEGLNEQIAPHVLKFGQRLS